MLMAGVVDLVIACTARQCDRQLYGIEIKLP
jgi:hypothetical protein